jgi:hypothetical protein
VFYFIALEESADITLTFKGLSGYLAYIDHTRLFRKPLNPSYTIIIQYDDGNYMVFRDDDTFKDIVLDQVMQEIKNAVSAEKSWAQSRESELDAALAAETERAQSRESELDAALAAETERAQSKESELDTALTAHKDDKGNPHAVTKAQVGLSNVDNTTDMNKPVSTAQSTAIAEVVESSVQKVDLIDDALHTDTDKAPTAKQIKLLNDRVGTLEQLGHWYGSYETYADLPTDFSARPITRNDYATVRADENNGNKPWRYIWTGTEWLADQPLDAPERDFTVDQIETSEIKDANVTTVKMADKSVTDVKTADTVVANRKTHTAAHYGGGAIQDME